MIEGAALLRTPLTPPDMRVRIAFFATFCRPGQVADSEGFFTEDHEGRKGKGLLIVSLQICESNNRETRLLSLIHI